MVFELVVDHEKSYNGTKKRIKKGVDFHDKKDN